MPTRAAPQRWVVPAAIGLSLALLLIVPFACPVNAEPPRMAALMDDARVWRAFRPLVIAAGNGNRERAVAYLQRSSQILRQADGHLERDAATEAFRARSLEAFEDFDFERFYALLPERRGPYRRFASKGHPEATHYSVERARGEGFEVHANSARRGFGESSAVVRVRKLGGEDDSRYLLQVRGGVGVGDVRWPSVVAGFSDALRLLELPASPDSPMVLRIADSFLRRHHGRLGPEDRRPLTLGWASFQKGSELLTRYSTVDDVLAQPPDGRGYAHVRYVSRWRPERIASDYPDLAEFMRDLGDLIDVRVRLDDAAGHTLATAGLNSERMENRLEMFVHDGAIVPSKDGKPLLDHAPRYERMTLHAYVHVVLHGIHIHVDDLRFDMRYRETSEGADLSMFARRPPRVRVKGKAFGVMPAGVLDWFIPGDVEGLAEQLFAQAVRGNEGRGIAWYGRFARPDDSGLATVDGQYGFEVVDSALIRFGMAIASGKLVPDEDTAEDIRRLAIAYRDAFDADLRNFAKHGRVDLDAP